MPDERRIQRSDAHPVSTVVLKLTDEHAPIGSARASRRA
jgi:hypothetical protein